MYSYRETAERHQRSREDTATFCLVNKTPGGSFETRVVSLETSVAPKINMLLSSSKLALNGKWVPTHCCTTATAVAREFDRDGWTFLALVPASGCLVLESFPPRLAPRPGGYEDRLMSNDHIWTRATCIGSQIIEIAPTSAL